MLPFELLTERLRLRPWVLPDDEAPALALYADPIVMRLYGDRTPWDAVRVARELARFHAHHEAHGYGPWALERRRDGALVGHCGLERFEDTGEVELCYLVGAAFVGCGYATEASRAALAFGRETLDLSRIAAVVYPENAASVRVLRKLGLCFERALALYERELHLYA